MFRRLLYLNGLAILCVVLFHTAGMGFVAMFSWAHRYLPAGVNAADQIGSPAYLALRFIEQIATFAIPTFLFVSGYFVAVATGKTQTTLRWSVVFSRIKTLLIPYLLWSLVVMALQVALEGKRLTPSSFFMNLLIGRTNDILYFIPLLIQFYLISPILVWIAKRNWKLLLGVTAVIQLIVILLPFPQFLNLDIAGQTNLVRLVPKWIFLARIFWFSWGIVFGFQLDLFRQFFQRMRWAALAIIVLAIPLGMWEWEMYFRLSGESWLAIRETLVDTAYSLAVITAVLAFLDVRLPLTRTFEKLGKESYGLYLTHFVFIEYTAKALYRLYPQVLGNQWVLQPILILVGLGLPLLLMYLLDRSPWRRYYAYVFG